MKQTSKTKVSKRVLSLLMALAMLLGMLTTGCDYNLKASETDGIDNASEIQQEESSNVSTDEVIIPAQEESADESISAEAPAASEQTANEAAAEPEETPAQAEEEEASEQAAEQPADETPETSEASANEDISSEDPAASEETSDEAAAEPEETPAEDEDETEGEEFAALTGITAAIGKTAPASGTTLEVTNADISSFYVTVTLNSLTSVDIPDETGLGLSVGFSPNALGITGVPTVASAAEGLTIAYSGMNDSGTEFYYTISGYNGTEQNPSVTFLFPANQIALSALPESNNITITAKVNSYSASTTVHVTPVNYTGISTTAGTVYNATDDPMVVTPGTTLSNLYVKVMFNGSKSGTTGGIPVSITLPDGFTAESAEACSLNSGKATLYAYAFIDDDSFKSTANSAEGSVVRFSSANAYTLFHFTNVTVPETAGSYTLAITVDGESYPVTVKVSNTALGGIDGVVGLTSTSLSESADMVGETATTLYLMAAFLETMPATGLEIPVTITLPESDVLSFSGYSNVLTGYRYCTIQNFAINDNVVTFTVTAFKSATGGFSVPMVEFSLNKAQVSNDCEGFDITYQAVYDGTTYTDTAHVNVERKVIATIGEGDDQTEYTSIQDAVDAAEAGDTIKVVKSTTESVTVSGKDVTFDIPADVTWTAGKIGTAYASAITVSGGASVTLTGSGTLTSANNCRAITATNSSVTVSGITVKASSSSYYITKEAKVTVATDYSESTQAITTSSQYAGGLILVNGGSFTMTSGSLSGVIRTSPIYGGAVAVINGTCNITGGTISGCGYGSGKTYGGAVYVGSTTSVNAASAVLNGTFSGNSAQNGGAVFAVAANISAGGTFSGNKANSWGGAIYAIGGTVTLNGTFTSNTAATYGGAVYGGRGVNVNVTGGTFSGNSAPAGGAIFYTSSDYTRTSVESGHALLSISGGTFTGNTATGTNGGGAVYSDNYAIISVTGGTFTGNTAVNGGALFVTASTANAAISGAAFTENTASNMGGAIYCKTFAASVFPAASRLVLSNVTITGNTALYGGGTAYYCYGISGKSGAGVTIDNSVATYGNTSTSVSDMITGTGGAHKSDEFFIYNDSTNAPYTLVGFDLAEDSDKLTVHVSADEYILALGGKSVGNTNSVGYYNDNDVGVAESECFNTDSYTYNYNDGTGDTEKTGAVILLDPMKTHIGEHYIWTEEVDPDTDEPLGTYYGRETTKDDIYVSGSEYTTDKIYTTVADAAAAAKELGIDTIIVCSKATLNCDVSGITFLRCSDNVSGFMFETSGSVTISNVKILNNNVNVGKTYNGYVPPLIDVNDTLTITGADTLIDGTGKGGAYGGLMSVNNATLNIEGGTFRNGKINQYQNSGGGAIYAQEATVNISGGTFCNNHSGKGGGAIKLNYNSVLNMTGGTFENNDAYYMGGAIMLCEGQNGQAGAVGYITGGTFTGNHVSTYDGGAIYVDGSGGYNSSLSYVAGTGSDAALYMMNVLVTGNYCTNTAALSIGQISSCSTGTTNIFSNNGALVTNTRGNEVDIYKRSGGTMFVSDTVLGGGQGNWSGSVSHRDGTYTGVIATTSKETAQTQTLAKESASVIISGNYIGYGATGTGTAIMNNGYLQIGTDEADLTVTKEWAEGTTPADSVTVQLAYKDSETGVITLLDKDTRRDAVQTLSAANNWTHTWIDLGPNIDWTVVEVSGDTYQLTDTEITSVEGTPKQISVTLTNEAATKYDLTISKTIFSSDEDKTFKFTIDLENLDANTLYAYTLNDEVTYYNTFDGSTEQSLAIDLANGDKLTFTGLGKDVTYTVTDPAGDYICRLTNANEEVTDYDEQTPDENGDVTFTGTFADGNVELDLINIETVELTVTKNWIGEADVDAGIRPDSIGVDLIGESDTDPEEVFESAVLCGAANIDGLEGDLKDNVSAMLEDDPDAPIGWNWTYTFENLPAYDYMTGEIITYRAEENETATIRHYYDTTYGADTETASWDYEYVTVEDMEDNEFTFQINNEFVYGYIQVVKTMDSYNESLGTVSFSFYVDSEETGSYNTLGVDVSSAAGGSSQAILVPVGTYTGEEVAVPANYEQSSANGITAEVTAANTIENPATLTFSNTYSGGHLSHDGYTNQYKLVSIDLDAGTATYQVTDKNGAAHEMTVNITSEADTPK